MNLGYTVPEHIKEAVNTQLETLPYLHLGEDLYPLQKNASENNWFLVV